jgi:hypothetical protein
LGRELKTLDRKRFPWFTREHSFAYRSKEVVKYVTKNRRGIYKMLNTETVLMDSILKFAIIDIPKLGLEQAVVVLRRAFNTQLRRFSDEFDLTKLAMDNVIVLPKPTAEEEMPTRRKKARTPAPSRSRLSFPNLPSHDRKGVGPRNPYYSFTVTVLTSVYCCNPYSPSSRPMPDCLKPPNGAAASNTS